jgi:hypothetical protein
MRSIAIGDRARLRIAVYARPAAVVEETNGNWDDLETTTRHAPKALLLSVDGAGARHQTRSGYRPAFRITAIFTS